MAIAQDSRWNVRDEKAFDGAVTLHRVTCDFCGCADEATNGRGSDGAAEAARKAGWRTVYPSMASPAKWKCPRCL